MIAQDRKLARYLAEQIAEAGEAALPQIRPALQRILEPRTASQRRSFLRHFRGYLRKAVREREIHIEYADQPHEATVQQLVEAFSRHRASPLRPVLVKNPELIAGYRITIGDTVIDGSIQSTLNRLAASNH